MLKSYRNKRNFTVTSEPYGDGNSSSGKSKAAAKAAKKLNFVIQKHAASRLHYDLRLEVDGVYRSWAVPKGPSLNPADKRLAVQVEDHPLEYGTFEGVIPAGQYGGGEVIVWDRGTWHAEDPSGELKSGKLKFAMQGEKIEGLYMLLRLPRDPSGKSWLLIKEKDEYANPKIDVTKKFPQSVKTGRLVEDLKTGVSRVSKNAVSEGESKKSNAKTGAARKQPKPPRSSAASNRLTGKKAAGKKAAPTKVTSTAATKKKAPKRAGDHKPTDAKAGRSKRSKSRVKARRS